MRKFFIDHYSDRKQYLGNQSSHHQNKYLNTPTKNSVALSSQVASTIKKRGIFEKEPHSHNPMKSHASPNRVVEDDFVLLGDHITEGTIRGTMRKAKSQNKNYIPSFDTQEYHVDRIIQYAKFRFHLNVESQKSLNGEIVYIMNITGGSGSVTVCINKQLLARVKELKSDIAKEKETLNNIEKKMDQMSQKMQMNMIVAVNKFQMGNMKQEISVLENLIFEKLKTFATLRPEHLTYKN